MSTPINGQQWAISFVRHESDTPNGSHHDLYRVTPDGQENRLVVQDVPLSYVWNPAGNSVALDQEVLVYGAGTANPYATWVKDLASGKETLVSYPSAIMGPFMEASWLDEHRLLTSRGTTGLEAKPMVVDISSGETNRLVAVRLCARLLEAGN